MEVVRWRVVSDPQMCTRVCVLIHKHAHMMNSLLIYKYMESYTESG